MSDERHVFLKAVSQQYKNPVPRVGLVKYRHHGRDPMVVGFTTTYAISAYHH